MKTIREIAEIAGVSKATMFRFITDNHFKETSIVNRAKMYDETSVNTILKAFKSKNDTSHFRNDKTIDSYTKSLEERVNELKKMNDILYNQLIAKDKQIAELQKLTDQQQQLALHHHQQLIAEKNNNSNISIWKKLFKK